MKKSKIIGAVIGVVLFVIMIAGVTYAWYTWRSNEISISGNSSCFIINYEISQEIGAADSSKSLTFGDSYEDGVYAAVTFGLNSSCTSITAKGNLYLNTNSVGTDQEILGGALKYQVVKKNNTTSELVDAGTINSTGRITLLSDIVLTAEAGVYTYEVWVWVDSTLVNDSYVNADYSGYISADAEQYE
ncbi:MAG: hypothetical protein IJZ46_01865 [Bacilli bacterium]|nr:hypothetical protein [Bacilli bacterium]